MKNTFATVSFCVVISGMITSSVAMAAGFATVAPMGTARTQYTATLLNNGKVLVAGGSSGVSLSSTEIYDPASNTWSPAASLSIGRDGHSATLLQSGKVLVVGGRGSTGYATSAEIYDPASNTWSATGRLTNGRADHTATLLTSGKVLVAGGVVGGAASSSVEIFDPASNTWSVVGSLSTVRTNHTATLLPSGKVLVAGGSGSVTLNTAEVFDPSSNSWTATGTLTSPRYAHSATLLPSGKVLVVGGDYGTGLLSSAETYDPASNTWSAAGVSLNNARYVHTATLLPSGKVLVAGGYGNAGYLNSAEVYDSASNTWNTAGSLNTARWRHIATLLPSGKVLIAGGNDSSGNLSSSELYDPASHAWSATGSLSTARIYHSVTLLPSGKVLVAGGNGNSATLSSTELYNPATNTWSAAGSLVTARAAHTATLLPSGKVLAAGGDSSTIGFLSAAEVYDPSSNTWTGVASLISGRRNHTATLLPSGKVLVTGGLGTTYLTSAEVYDPASNTWTPVASLNSGRYDHTATLLTSGKVLVAGGYNNSSGVLSSAEVYDPAVNSWTLAGNLGTARETHTSSLLPDGRVLITGGYNNSNVVASTAELYDPSSNTWSPAGSLSTPRSSHTATVLPSGKVLAVGGTSTIFGYGLTSAEVYDSASNMWSVAGTFNTAHKLHPATLLLSGKVLVVGGIDNAGNTLGGADLGDDGLQYQDIWRPTINSASSPVGGSALTMTGTNFKGNSEASGGSQTNSSSNYPIVQLRSVCNEQATVLYSDSAHPWSNAGFTSLPISSTFPPGYATATVFTNGIPSVAAMVLVVKIGLVPASGVALSAQVGAPYTQQFTASSSSSSYAYNYTITTGALPAGMTMNSAGFLAGTPTAGGAFNFTIAATTTDGSNFTGSQAYSLNVTAPNIAFTPASPLNVKVGVAYNQTLTASGGTAPYNTFSIASSTLPAGLSLNSTTGALSGTPTAGGTFNFTVTTKDSSTGTGPYTSIPQSYTLIVSAPTISITPTTLSDGMVNVAYNQPLTAIGGTSTYSFNFLSGSLPNGVTIGSGGTLTGTPSAAGSYNFTIRATDSSTGTGSPYTGNQTYTLTVAKAIATVAFNPTSLNQTYDGNPKPATSTTNPGALVVSNTYNGSIVVPTAAGTYTVVATISDANYQGTATGTLTIIKATPVITWPTPGSIVSGTALSSVQLNATASVPGTFVYNPPLGTLLSVGNGQALAVQITPTDSTNYSTTSATVSINVLPSSNVINQTPQFAFASSSPVTIANNIGAQTINGFATAITAGAGGEDAFQTVQFVVKSNSNAAIFTATGAPAISSTGTLSFTPNPFASGQATISVLLQDDGKKSDGSAGTVASSSTQSFVINVSASPPSLPNPFTSSAMAGANFSYPLLAKGGGTMIYAMGGAPSWLTLSGISLSGIPLQADSLSISMVASNGTPPDDKKTMTIVVVPQLIISTAAGTGTAGTSSDGTLAANAMLSAPSGVAQDSRGNIFIADTSNGLVRKVDGASGVISSVATGLNKPSAVAVDSTGSTVFICEQGANRVSTVDASKTVTSYYAGTGTGALNTPTGVALDSQGNLYIADSGNKCVRKIGTDKNMTVFAGLGNKAGAAGDNGPATAAQLNIPYGVACDSAGNVYIADKGDHVVRMVDAAGLIHTLAGQFGSNGFSGDGSLATAAQLFSPQAVSVDAAGNIFIADSSNRLVREIQKKDGIMVTLAGRGTDGDGKPSFGALLSTPAGVSAGSTLLIADSGGQRVRRLSVPGKPNSSSAPSVTPNPAQVAQVITMSWSVVSSTSVTYAWNFGDGSKDTSGASSVTHAYANAGSYTATVTATDQTGQTLSATVPITVKLSLIVPDESLSEIAKLYPNDFGSMLPDPSEAPSTLGLKINSLAFNFNKSGKDSLSLAINMTLVETIDLTLPKCLRLAIDIGGVVKVFDLKPNKKKATDTSFTATSKEGIKSDTIKGQTLAGKSLNLTAGFKNETFAATLTSSSGLKADAPSGTVIAIPCSVLYGGHLYTSVSTVLYSAKKGAGSGKGQ